MTEIINYEVKRPVNAATLTEELRAAVPDAVTGVTTIGERVIIHLLADSTDDQRRQALAVLDAHDPAKLTPAQAIREASVASQRELADIIADRIAWHQANPPDTAADALAVVTRMQAEWVAFLRWLRGSGWLDA